jgi:dihydroorotate dehydrogenase
MNLYSFFKPLAFQTDPENIHDLSMNIFSKLPQVASLFPSWDQDDRYKLSDGHMCWNNPVGLAAGFDKNAKAIDFFSRVGFGAIELGTVTLESQAGNDKPRIWRYPNLLSIRNAMGFPNLGSQEIYNNIIQQKKTGTPLGVNIGKNKKTSVSDTPSEYAKLYEIFAPISDYLVINISSPNTPGLRELQTKDAFTEICKAVEEKRKLHPKPLYLKISPDSNTEDIRDLVELSKEYKMSGIIATNTTSNHQFQNGGMSGSYIKDISHRMRKLVCEMTKETKDLSVIGVGGINSFEEIIEFWKDGGSMVQLYSSFIFEGPKVLTNIKEELDLYMVNLGLSNVQQLVDSFKR